MFVMLPSLEGKKGGVGSAHLLLTSLFFPLSDNNLLFNLKLESILKNEPNLLLPINLVYLTMMSY